MLTAASSAGTLRSVRPLNVSNDTQAHTTRSIALNTYSSKPQSLRPAWFGVYRPATLLARQCSPTGWKPGSLERKATGGRCTISSAAIAGETTDGAAKEQKWKSVKKVFITVGGKGVTSKHCNSLKELLKSHGLASRPKLPSKSRQSVIPSAASSSIFWSSTPGEPFSKSIGSGSSRPTGLRTGSFVCCATPEESTEPEVESTAAFTQPNTDSDSPSFSPRKILLILVDSNPYLSSGSKQALATALKVCQSLKSRLTVAFLDEQDSTIDLKVRSDTIQFYVDENRCEEVYFKILELKMGPEDKGTLVVTDMAEEVNAEMVILSTDPVHEKVVDVNLLSEFILCPVMLVPDA